MIMSYSITPLTKLFRDNDIPKSPLVKGRGKSTGNYGNVIWRQVKDGYTYMKSRDSSVVSFEVQGRDVYDKMLEILNDNNVEIERQSHNYEYGGSLTVDLKQFYD